MKIPVSNLGLGEIRPPQRMAFQLGVPSAQEILAVTPDSVPPQKVSPLPMTTDEANKARISYRISAEALSGKDGQGGTIKWLDGIRAANWQETALEVIRQSKIQYDVLVRSVRGRTGNSDAEYELELQWWGLWDRAYQLYQAPPSWLEGAADKIARFFEDFKVGAQQAWQGYSDWAIRNAGPLLRNYHGSIKKLLELRADLEQARVSGEFSAGQIMDQEAALASAESSAQMVRNTYSAISAGSDIDKLAVENFGPYSMSGGAVGAIFSIVSTVIIGSLIIILGLAVDGVGKMVGSVVETVREAFNSVKNMIKDSPVGAAITIGAIGAMIALPFVLFKGTSSPQAPAPVSEAT